MSVIESTKGLSKEIQSHLQDGRRGERLRSGIQVTIIGAPNAGKSSLLNILCKQMILYLESQYTYGNVA